MSFGEKFLNRKKKDKTREIALNTEHVWTAVEQYLWAQRLIKDNEKVEFVGPSELSGKSYIIIKEE